MKTHHGDTENTEVSTEKSRKSVLSSAFPLSSFSVFVLRALRVSVVNFLR